MIDVEPISKVITPDSANKSTLREVFEPRRLNSSKDSLLLKGADGLDYETPEALFAANKAWRERICETIQVEKLEPISNNKPY